MWELSVVSRVLHVSTAIVLVGGVFFIRSILMPAAARVLTDAQHAALREAVMASWKRVVHLGITLMLASGFFNYLRGILNQEHKGDGLYHGLLGTKILIAFVIFFISSALVGRSAGLQRFRDNARFWMGINLLLALVIVAISGFLKVRGLPNPVIPGS